MSEKVLVTGANGFIGSKLCETLLKNRFHVTGLVRSSSDLHYLKGLDVKLVFGDITDIVKLSSKIGKVETIYHVAGLASDWGEYRKFHETNVTGTLKVLRFAKKIKAKKTVILSSLSVMGFNQKSCSENDTPKIQNTPYVISKSVMEKMALGYARRNRINITILRPGDVYGPHDRTTTLKLLEALENGKMGFINGGRALLSPLYIENLIQAMKKASAPDMGVNQIYNITDGISVTWQDYIGYYCNTMKIPLPSLNVHIRIAYVLAWFSETLYKIFRIKSPPLLTCYRVNHAGLDYDFKIDKAINGLNYHPDRNLKKHVEHTVNWYNTLKKTKQKILITGATGLWGYQLLSYFIKTLSKNFDIYATYRNIKPKIKDVKMFKMDLANHKSVDLTLKKTKPDIIIHTAAISKLKECEADPQAAIKTNQDATERICQWSNLYKSKLFFFSTDLVYGGKTPGLHLETDRLHPKYVYEKTKLAAEKIIKNRCYNYIILRTALSYGPSNKYHASFINWILTSMKNNENIYLFSDQFRTPISTIDGGKAIEAMIKLDIKNQIINFGGTEKISRYDFGLILAQTFKLDKNLIIPVTYENMKGKTELPNRDTSMNIERLLNIYPKIKSIKENLKIMKKTIKNSL